MWRSGTSGAYLVSLGWPTLTRWTNNHHVLLINAIPHTCGGAHFILVGSCVAAFKRRHPARVGRTRVGGGCQVIKAAARIVGVGRAQGVPVCFNGLIGAAAPDAGWDRLSPVRQQGESSTGGAPHQASRIRLGPLEGDLALGGALSQVETRIARGRWPPLPLPASSPPRRQAAPNHPSGSPQTSPWPSRVACPYVRPGSAAVSRQKT